MRMRKMRHPNLGDAVIEVAESAVPHHQRAGWVEADNESADKAHPANTPSQDPAVVREPVGAEAPADAEAKPTVARRARNEGSA